MEKTKTVHVGNLHSLVKVLLDISEHGLLPKERALNVMHLYGEATLADFFKHEPANLLIIEHEIDNGKNILASLAGSEYVLTIAPKPPSLEDRLVRDGCVAVVYSVDNVTELSTTPNDDTLRCFNKRIALAVLEESGESVRDAIHGEYPEFTVYGEPDILVEWLPVGTKFIVTNDEGAESLIVHREIDWLTA